MDRKRDVEVFRNMLQSEGLISFDESIISCFLSSDPSAVSYFVETYYGHINGSISDYLVAHSPREWKLQFERDLVKLTLWGQLLSNLYVAIGTDAVCNSIEQLGFKGFMKMNDREVINLFVTTRSKAARAYCSLREDVRISTSNRKEVCSLLKSMKTG